MELEKKADNGNEIDFDALIENVKKMPEREGQILLWAITFRLEKWYFLARPVSDPGESRPFIGEVDGRGWVLYSLTVLMRVNLLKDRILCIRMVQSA